MTVDKAQILRSLAFSSYLIRGNRARDPVVKELGVMDEVVDHIVKEQQGLMLWTDIEQQQRRVRGYATMFCGQEFLCRFYL